MLHSYDILVESGVEELHLHSYVYMYAYSYHSESRASSVPRCAGGVVEGSTHAQLGQTLQCGDVAASAPDAVQLVVGNLRQCGQRRARLRWLERKEWWWWRGSEAWSVTCNAAHDRTDCLRLRVIVSENDHLESAFIRGTLVEVWSHDSRRSPDVIAPFFHGGVDTEYDERVHALVEAQLVAVASINAQATEVIPRARHAHKATPLKPVDGKSYLGLRRNTIVATHHSAGGWRKRLRGRQHQRHTRACSCSALIRHRTPYSTHHEPCTYHTPDARQRVLGVTHHAPYNTHPRTNAPTHSRTHPPTHTVSHAQPLMHDPRPTAHQPPHTQKPRDEHDACSVTLIWAGSKARRTGS